MDTPLDAINHEWKLQSPYQQAALNKVTTYIHQLCQFVSMAGRAYLPHAADDSHTTLDWDDAGVCLLGQTIRAPRSGMIAAVSMLPFELRVLDEERSIMTALSVSGRTKEQVIEWFKDKLVINGLDPETFSMDLHYNIPAHAVNQGQPFEKGHDAMHKEFAAIRANGHLAINALVQSIPGLEPARTWPHHFDVGTVFYKRDADGNILHTIGIGLAMQDGLVNDHYYYVTHRNEEGPMDFSMVPALPEGAYWDSETLKGAIMPNAVVAQVENAHDQAALVAQFFKIAIPACFEVIQETVKL